MFNIFVRHTTDQSRAQYRFGLLAMLVVAAGLVLGQIQPGTLYTDGGIFSAVAMKDLGAGTLYVDAWENKPPATFYLIEIFLLLIPHPVYALFVLVLLVFTGTAACLYMLFYHELKSFTAAMLLSAAALYYSLYKNNIGDGLFTEIHGTLSVLISLLAARQYEQSGKNSQVFWAGFFAGLAFWFKEPFVLICIPLIVLQASGFRRKGKLKSYLLSVALPTLLMISVLYLRGSLAAFTGVLKYNFLYASAAEGVAAGVKIKDLYGHLLLPNAGLLIFAVMTGLKNTGLSESRQETLLWIAIMLASAGFVFLSPYNFGHYYHSFFVLFFVFVAKMYRIYSDHRAFPLKLPLIIFTLYSLYQTGRSGPLQWTLQIRPYQADRIAAYLQQQGRKTLFVDYVAKSDYYAKSGLLYPTFLPVGLPVHFGETEQGLQHRSRIWKDLSSRAPDFLITTFTHSYFSWSLPESGFYERHYSKTDSLVQEGEHIIYLWKKKE